MANVALVDSRAAMSSMMSSGGGCSLPTLHVRLSLLVLATRMEIQGQRATPRSGYYLFQTLSVAIQRGNAACVMETFGLGQTKGERHVPFSSKATLVTSELPLLLGTLPLTIPEKGRIEH
ncbi:hypothetical protein EVAR_10721_1 [Eumeta japonica]|uniref:Uncharacterized protein n=1 Tax=Eumeta variegata TaxID=151549 RepID=A0A4C1U7B3_EUMVA|nr:hypothetical protein EVAR_10721_1 [Eumeta japonica]